MESNSSLLFAKALTKFVKNILRAYVNVDGVVTQVNDNFTVDITIQDIAYTDVPTVVLKGSQASVYAIPVVNTKCLVSFRDGSRSLPQIISFDQIDTWKINCKTLVEFNGGEQGGMVLVKKLVEQVNKIENQQNSILNILKAVEIPSTPFSFSPLFAAVNDLTPTNESQIENTKITQ